MTHTHLPQVVLGADRKNHCFPHAKDDKMADFKNVEPWIARIKDCTFIALDSGGHLMEGNSKKIDEAVKKFITK